MFTTLLESRARKQRSVGGTLVSMSMHAALIVLAIQATLHAGQRREPQPDVIRFADVKHDEPAPPKPKVAEVEPAAPKGSPVLTAPVNIPDQLPDIDLSRKPTNELDWIGKGASGGSDTGVVVVARPGNQVYSESQVEKAAMVAPGSLTPRYPEVLKSAGVEGEVLVTFVVDTTGRADASSVTILNSTNELFGAAVKTAIPGMRFLPAEVAGRKVRQLVQEPFVFKIVK